MCEDGMWFACSVSCLPSRSTRAFLTPLALVIFSHSNRKQFISPTLDISAPPSQPAPRIRRGVAGELATVDGEKMPQRVWLRHELRGEHAD